MDSSQHPVSLVLASGSPRRHDLLRSIGLTFTPHPPDIDESPEPGEDPLCYVERLATDKCLTVAKEYDPSSVCVLAADTTVAIDGAILGKPEDDHDARHMLGRLSGSTHLVHTGVCCAFNQQHRTISVTTEVTFDALPAELIDWYLSLGEHLDKAGAYGMQSGGAALVSTISGSPSNVVGLPVRETRALIASIAPGITG